MGTQEARENANGTGGTAVTWSKAMFWARRRVADSGGRRYAVCGFRYVGGWRYYVLLVGSRPWENAKRYAPRERLIREL